VSHTEKDQDIAVVGMACRFPHAKDLPDLWRLVTEGEVAFEDIQDTRWKHSAFYEPNDVRAPDKTYVRKGAFIDGVDEFAALHYGLAPRRVQVMDPQQRLAIEATRQALQDAGYDKKAFDRASTGVFFGASVSEYKDLMGARNRALQLAAGEFGDKLSPHEAEAVRAAAADVVPIRAFSIAGGLLNMIACSVSQTFDLQGPAIQIDAACSSALVAIHEASVNLRARECNVAVAGGVYLNLNPDNLIGFARIGAISPSGVCRPFDAHADGFVMGEGVGVVVLKRHADAVRDGDRIYAVIRGSGCNNDGRGEGPMTPRPEGQRAAMERAHHELAFPVESIGYVETHGTATTVGDAVEVGALKNFFETRLGRAVDAPWCYLGSIKANIGHTMSAAGVAGFIKTCLMLYHGVIPPQPGINELNPKLDLGHSPFRLSQKMQPWLTGGGPRRAAVSSFGFGGTNAHALLEESPRPAPVAEERPELYLLSAPTFDLLRAHAASLASAIEAQRPACAEVAATLASRTGFDARVAFVATGRDELLASLHTLAQGETPAKAVRGTPLSEAERKVAFLFPGQGAQKVGLLKDLVTRFPHLRNRLEAFDRAAAFDVGSSLTEALYPQAPFDAAAAQRHLTSTEVCQPAMAALSLAVAEQLEALGVHPQVTLGHSLGEFAAAAAAGLLPSKEAVRFVAQRGQLMKGLALADPGAMLAVMAEREQVEPLLQLFHGVALANHNHPTQVVLSGTTAGIDEAQVQLTARGLKVTRLDVSHAFHSPLMAGIDEGMRARVAALHLAEPRHTFISCIEARPYAAAAEARDIWVRHGTAPVRFVEAIEACVREGVTHFVQVGAGGALLSFARGVAPHGHFLSLAPSDGNDGGAMFLQALGQLWVAGVNVDGRALVPQARLTPLPPTPLEVQKYWAMERTQRAPRQPLMPAGSVVKHAAASVLTPSSSTHTSSPLKAPAMDNLIALFQQQMALLQSHAEVVKAQAQALQALGQGAGQGVALEQLVAQVPQPVAAHATGVQAASAVALQSVVLSTPMAPPPHTNGNGHAHGNGHSHAVPKPPNFSNLVAPRAEAKPAAAPVVAAPAPAADLKPEVTQKVLASAARISAFPVAALKLDATLVGELGFDSLMLVELDQDIAKAYPSLGGLPRELFSKNTTLTTIIAHVVKTLESGGPAIEEVKAPTLPAERYVPQVVAVPRAQVREHVAHFTGPLFLTRDAHGVAEALSKRLTARGLTVQVGEQPAAGVVGVVHLAALGVKGDVKAPVHALLALSQKLDAEKAELFVTVTGLGGRFGYDGVESALLGQVGALGFTKALAQEWPQALVKAIDVDLKLGAEALAAELEQELLGGDRGLEVGFTAQGRVGVSLQAQQAGTAKAAPLTADSVVLVTGGAKGLGLQFAKALAKQYGCKVVLAGRSAPSAEVAKATSQVKSAGAKTCTYQALDTRDAASLKATLDAVKAKEGRLDAVVHAAGVVADALVGKKTTAQLDQVIDTKLGGALALLAAAGDLKLLINVGSWAGRFGNAAQTDYSAANEMLARLAQGPRGGTRVVTIDFPPFEGSEMVKKIPAFRKAELLRSGVTFLSDEEGVATLLAEVASGAGEVLVGRGVAERTLAAGGSFPLSVETHPYLVDHTMAGQRVLPLAGALDHVAAASLDALGAKDGAAFTVTGFSLQRPVLANEPSWLSTRVTGSVRAGAAGTVSAQLKQGAALSYQGSVTLGAEGTPTVQQVTGTASLPLSLADFYGGFTFHGPKLQGITRIETLGEQGVVGWVKGSTPAQWQTAPQRSAWAVDPLIIDASFQLAGYWAWVKQERAGFPVGFDRFTQYHPFGAGPVKCTVTFEAASEDVFMGTLTWQDEAGRVLAVMTGAKAEFKKRDPQFQVKATPAPKVAEPKAEVAEARPVVAPVAAEAEAVEAGPAQIPLEEAFWNPAKFPEYELLQERLQMAEAFGLRNPYFSVHEALCGDTTVVGGKEMINFSSYNYVGSSGDPVVSKAAQDAIARYGTSVSASRVASGEKPLTLELERALADFFGTEDCIVLVSGHATNVTVIGHVVGAGDLIVHDALAHDSIVQGAKLSGAKRRPFPHNDWQALDRLLTQVRGQYKKVLICIEGTYSMDGDIPDLPKFIEVKKKHHALLLVDEAHSAGVVGDTGRGVGEYFHVNRADVDMWMGTLSKSFASCGGYIAGSKALVEYLKYTTPGFVFSVGIPPPNAAAALAATQQILAHPERVKQAKANAARFIQLLKDRGVDTGMSKDTAVVPAIIGNSVLCLQLSDALKTHGVNVQPILYPAVEEDQARLRFFLSSLHKDEQLVRAADLVKRELDRLKAELFS
jgi:acyl transferase domain-containing protein/7-keto-8-aminopelargonate synthetase-like enzyme